MSQCATKGNGELLLLQKEREQSSARRTLSIRKKGGPDHHITDVSDFCVDLYPEGYTCCPKFFFPKLDFCNWLEALLWRNLLRHLLKTLRDSMEVVKLF